MYVMSRAKTETKQRLVLMVQPHRGHRVASCFGYIAALLPQSVLKGKTSSNMVHSIADHSTAHFALGWHRMRQRSRGPHSREPHSKGATQQESHNRGPHSGRAHSRAYTAGGHTAGGQSET